MCQCKKLFILFYLCFYFSGYSQTNKKEVLQNKKAQIQKEIKFTNSLLQKAKKDKNESVNTLNTITKQIQQREAVIKELNLEVDMAESQIKKIKTKVQEIEKDIFNQNTRLDSLKKEYATMLQHVYHNRHKYNRLAFVFSSTNYNQALKRIRYLQEYSKFRKKQVQEIESAELKLEERLQALKKQKVLLLVAKSDKEQSLSLSKIEYSNLDLEKKSQANLLSKLKKREKQLRNDITSKEAKSSALDNQIRKIIAEEIRLASKRATKKDNALTITPEDQELAENFILNKGKLPWPVETGIITERFGVQKHPVLAGVETFNNGVKIVTQNGAKVRAVFDGAVTRIINIPGVGKAIILSHGEYFSVYSNLIEVSVKQGQDVFIKERIGTIITNSKSNETVTELQIWKGSEKLDPSEWLYMGY